MKPSKLPGGIHLLDLHQSFTMEPSRRGSLLQSQILIWTGHLYVWNGMDSTNYKPQTPDKKRQFLTKPFYLSWYLTLPDFYGHQTNQSNCHGITPTYTYAFWMKTSSYNKNNAVISYTSAVTKIRLMFKKIQKSK